MDNMGRRIHVTVEVTLSEREYKHFKARRAFTGEGTVEAAIRQQLFNSDARPYGATRNPRVLTELEYYAEEIRRMREDDEDEETGNA